MARPVVPSALFQVSETLSTIAPVYALDVVTVNEPMSFVTTVHEPSTLCVPPFKVQSDGDPVIAKVTSPLYPVGSVKPKLIGDPATPAGKVARLPEPRFPARSV